MLNIILIVGGALFVLYYLVTRKFNYWKKRNVPHLPPIPLLGNYGSHILQKKTIFEVVQELCNKFPGVPVVGAYFGTEPVLIPRDPEIIKRILTKDFYFFNGREISDHAYRDAEIFQLFASHGNHWKVLRQNLTPLFSSAKMKLMFEMIAQCSHSMEKLLEKEANMRNEDVDVKNLMDRFTIQCIGACVFGVDTSTLEKNEDNPFKEAGKNIVNFSKFVAFKAIVRSIWPSIFYGIGMKIFTNELSLFKQIVTAVFTQRDYKSVNRNDFVDLILTWKQKSQIEGDKLSPAGSSNIGKAAINVTDDLLFAQCFVFFTAGYETSSTTLTFALYELAKNEKAQNKLHDEIDSYIARHKNKINYECLSELQYLDACLEETLRLYPVLGVITREVMEKYTLMPGVTLDKGLRVHIPVYYLQHNPEFFPEPEDFRPERFYGPEKSKILPYTHMPFGEGPRICIGMRFAKMQSMAGLISILKTYRVELADDMPKTLKFQPEKFVIAPNEPIRLKFIKREGWEQRLYAK